MFYRIMSEEYKKEIEELICKPIDEAIREFEKVRWEIWKYNRKYKRITRSSKISYCSVKGQKEEL